MAHKVTISFFIACLSLAGVPATAQDTFSMPCKGESRSAAPGFRVAHRYSNPAAHSMMMNIGISPRDASLDKVAALACLLGERNAQERVLVVWIFDDFGAAKRFRPSGEGVSEGTRHALRAAYNLDRDKESQDLTWTPDPKNPLNSRKIDLSFPPPSSSF